LGEFASQRLQIGKIKKLPNVFKVKVSSDVPWIQWNNSFAGFHPDFFSCKSLTLNWSEKKGLSFDQRGKIDTCNFRHDLGSPRRIFNGSNTFSLLIKATHVGS
jgi:hypothetical protein